MKLRLIFSLLFFHLIILHGYKLNSEFQNWIGCISYHEVQPILSNKFNALKSHEPIEFITSIDLGLSKSKVYLDSEGLCSDAKQLLATWDELEYILNKKNGCYALFDDGSKPWHISTISKSTNIPASLCPPLTGSGAPTMVLGGFTMHRISGGEHINPMFDTSNKLASIPIGANTKILDTCMGLGYTATGAAKILQPKGLGRVTTIEYDEASVEMCSYNPWSKGLFDQSLPLEIIVGDSCEIVKSFEEQSFDCIIHDPPARALCKTDLYGLQFYIDLFRILKKPKGYLFHYIGNPNSKESGKLYKGITNRLKEAGFNNIKIAENAFGLVAET